MWTRTHTHTRNVYLVLSLSSVCVCDCVRKILNVLNSICVSARKGRGCFVCVCVGGCDVIAALKFDFKANKRRIINFLCAVNIYDVYVVAASFKRSQGNVLFHILVFPSLGPLVFRFSLILAFRTIKRTLKTLRCTKAHTSRIFSCLFLLSITHYNK